MSSRSSSLRLFVSLFLLWSRQSSEEQRTEVTFCCFVCGDTCFLCVSQWCDSFMVKHFWSILGEIWWGRRHASPPQGRQFWSIGNRPPPAFSTAPLKLVMSQFLCQWASRLSDGIGRQPAFLGVPVVCNMLAFSSCIFVCTIFYVQSVKSDPGGVNRANSFQISHQHACFYWGDQGIKRKLTNMKQGCATFSCIQLSVVGISI